MSDDLYDGPCEAGCISFHGGERKHHKDCGHYPHSLTKVNADRIAELEAKLANLAHAVWTEHKDWEGERKYALRQIVKWLVRAGQD